MKLVITYAIITVPLILLLLWSLYQEHKENQPPPKKEKR